jgi:hypothetical protein
MAGSYDYIIPVVYSAKDNETFINKRSYLIKECVNNLIPNNLADLWNANLCGSDECYCQPYVAGDMLYLQYIIDNSNLSNTIIQLVDQATGEPIENYSDFLSIEQGQDENKTTFLNLIINTAGLTSCFYVKMFLFECEPDEEVLEECINTKKAEGKTQAEAELECWIQLCGEGVSEKYSEPYCPSDCYNTILIEGYYKDYDCNGNYYGAFIGGGTNSYKPSVRIPGELFLQNIANERTLVNNKPVAMKTRDVYRLRSKKVPPYVARQVAVCFAGLNYFINGDEYITPGNIDKNFEEGQMWIIDTTVNKECENNNLSCNT